MPLIPAVLLFTLGIGAVHTLAHLPDPSALALLSLPALLPWRGRALWSALALGVLLTVVRAQALLDERWPVERHGQDHVLEGTIASLPEREGANWRFVFAPADPAFPRLIRAGWYRTDEPVRAGECWRLTLRLRSPHGSLNPDSFDYEGWLFRQGIGATATVRDARRCDDLQGGVVLRARQHIVAALRSHLGTHPAAGVTVALAVGDDSGVASADWENFRATGTTHLVAISGFNIAIVAGVAWFLGRWLWSAWPALCLRLPAQRAGLLASALAAAVYAALAGFEPPVQRAVLMLLIVLLALWSHRLSQPARVLALAWAAVLLLDPFAFASPGLWLSFGAVASIFYVSLNRVRAPGPWHTLVSLQLLIALTLAPLSLYFFHGTSWVAPMVNLFAVPFFALLTPWVLAATLLVLAAPAVGGPVLLGAAAALCVFQSALGWIATQPGLWLAASPPPGALALALAGFALLLAPRGLPLRPLGALCLVPLIAAPIPPVRGGFELTALDVGQGLAVVVRTATRTLVYDAGPAFEDGFDAGASVVAPFLLGAGRNRVDTLVVSHGDQDHAGGVPAVRRLLRVDREIGTDGGEPCRAGMHWEWDDVRFELLHPAGDGWRGNDRSCVLRIDGAYAVLLTGDIEAPAEAALLDDKARLAADVLVAPHHGSRTSSTQQFVEAVNPRVVLFGAGWRNHFRHPRPEVQARYEAIGARRYVTGQVGAIAVWRNAEGELQVSEHRREAARFWNAPAGP
ncbi:MAG TPA: DNA internalization-related competence protein ComEC/Rec2 [Verrucomicrobiae bacterium]|nr:DNA internalization-related competence protein ComEC/Rec2 [Verrucomicrobiae bacterium]